MARPRQPCCESDPVTTIIEAEGRVVAVTGNRTLFGLAGDNAVGHVVAGVVARAETVGSIVTSARAGPLPASEFHVRRSLRAGRWLPAARSWTKGEGGGIAVTGARPAAGLGSRCTDGPGPDYARPSDSAEEWGSALRGFQRRRRERHPSSGLRGEYREHCRPRSP